MWKLAGVTFENRQSILGNIVKNIGKEIICDLVDTIYNGEPAIKVLERSSKKQIGWVPRQNLKELYNKNIEKIYGEIGYYKETYFVRLYEPVRKAVI